MTTDAAEYLGVTAQTLCKWAKENKIKRHSYGWFARDELNRFVNQGAQKT